MEAEETLLAPLVRSAPRPRFNRSQLWEGVAAERSSVGRARRVAIGRQPCSYAAGDQRIGLKMLCGSRETCPRALRLSVPAECFFFQPSWWWVIQHLVVGLSIRL